MSETFTVHASFTIEREFAVPPRKVFRAWADPQAKRQWMTCEPGMVVVDHRVDFRPGGDEIIDVRGTDGALHRFQGRYYDIVEDRRIVYSFGMHVDAAHLSASLATVQFAASVAGTKMTFTEQIVFLDGQQQLDERRLGTEAGFDHLALYLHESTRQ
ncbi:SRPBCC family protein [Lysobacter sp. CA199]|uniref:SRPBCC family protein n=1 Tax=Lysobacter sp. CA199 TaxID=3455608 RepID=UPI003F8D2864